MYKEKGMEETPLFLSLCLSLSLLLLGWDPISNAQHVFPLSVKFSIPACCCYCCLAMSSTCSVFLISCARRVHCASFVFRTHWGAKEQVLLRFTFVRMYAFVCIFTGDESCKKALPRPLPHMVMLGFVSFGCTLYSANAALSSSAADKWFSSSSDDNAVNFVRQQLITPT